MCCVCFIADVPNQSNFNEVQCYFSHECCSSLKNDYGQCKIGEYGFGFKPL